MTSRACVPIINSSVVIGKHRKENKIMKAAALAPLQAPKLAPSAPKTITKTSGPAKKTSFFASKAKPAPKAKVNNEDEMEVETVKEKPKEKSYPAPKDVAPILKPAIVHIPKPVIVQSAKSQKQEKEITSLFDDEDEPGINKIMLAVDDAVLNPGIDMEVDIHAEPAKKIRKRRKIKKTVTYMDGKYMKTKDETDWESYSESDLPPKKMAKPAMIVKESKGKAKSKDSNGNGKPKQVQRTINFFGNSK